MMYTIFLLLRVHYKTIIRILHSIIINRPHFMNGVNDIQG